MHPGPVRSVTKIPSGENTVYRYISSAVKMVLLEDLRTGQFANFLTEMDDMDKAKSKYSVVKATLQAHLMQGAAE